MNCIQRNALGVVSRQSLKRVNYAAQVAFFVSGGNRFGLKSPHFSKFLVSSATRDYAFPSFLHAILAHGHRPLRSFIFDIVFTTMRELYTSNKVIGAMFSANVFVESCPISFHVTDERHQKDT